MEMEMETETETEMEMETGLNPQSTRSQRTVDDLLNCLSTRSQHGVDGVFEIWHFPYLRALLSLIAWMHPLPKADGGTSHGQHSRRHSSPTNHRRRDDRLMCLVLRPNPQPRLCRFRPRMTVCHWVCFLRLHSRGKRGGAWQSCQYIVPNAYT